MAMSEILIIMNLVFHHLKSKVHWCIFLNIGVAFWLVYDSVSHLFRYGQMPLSRTAQRGNFSLMELNRQKGNCHKLICFFWVFLSVVSVLGEYFCLFSGVMSLLDSTPWRAELNVISFSRCKKYLAPPRSLTKDFIKRQEIIQYRLEVMTPWTAGKPRLCRGQWPRSTEVKKIFRHHKTEVGFTAGSLPRVKKTQHAAVKKNMFCLMKYFNPRVIQSFDLWISEISVETSWKKAI